MKTSYTVVSGGNGFDAGVLPPGPLRPGTTEPKRELDDPYMGALHGLLFERGLLSEKEDQEVMRLMNERTTLNEQCSKLLDGVRARARVKVTAEWEEAKRAVRDQQKKIAKHHAEIAELQRELNRMNELKTLAFGARDSAQEEQRRLSRYSEKRDIERANQLVVKREAACDVAAREAAL